MPFLEKVAAIFAPSEKKFTPTAGSGSGFALGGSRQYYSNKNALKQSVSKTSSEEELQQFGSGPVIITSDGRNDSDVEFGLTPSSPTAGRSKTGLRMDDIEIKKTFEVRSHKGDGEWSDFQKRWEVPGAHV